ncbi:MAG: DUF3822 family protein [Bacteroidales bacterium]|nr:DUF3822 family protein [Bacteroidales bacterium]
MNTFKLESFIQTEQQIVTNESNLSICLKADGFIFAVIDSRFRLNAIGEFIVDLSGSITQVMTNVKACFSSIGVHIFNFKKTRIVCPTDRNVWIPYKLYDNTKNKEYLKTVTPVHSSDTVISNVCDKLDAVNIFAYSLQQYSGLKIVMPKAQFVCPSFVEVEYAFDASSLMQNTLVLNKRAGSCDFVIFKGSSFTISNSFTYQTPEDLVYFILYTLQQLEINTSEVNLMITGDEYEQSELNILRRYIKNVSYANPSENIIVPNEFGDLDLQKYFLVIA